MLRSIGWVRVVIYTVALVTVIFHPIMLVLIVLIVLLWLLCSSALGASRLLRYGGRRAKRDWHR